MAKLCMVKVKKKNVRATKSLGNISSRTDVIKRLKSRLKRQMLYELISCFQYYEPIVLCVHTDCCLLCPPSSYLWHFPILGTPVKEPVSLQS